MPFKKVKVKSKKGCPHGRAVLHVTRIGRILSFGGYRGISFAITRSEGVTREEISDATYHCLFLSLFISTDMSGKSTSIMYTVDSSICPYLQVRDSI